MLMHLMARPHELAPYQKPLLPPTSFIVNPLPVVHETRTVTDPQILDRMTASARSWRSLLLLTPTTLKSVFAILLVAFSPANDVANSDFLTWCAAVLPESQKSAVFGPLLG